jgi:uncharacterized membrane protein
VRCAVANQWPSCLAYATGFLTIGALWLGHHGIFRRLASARGVVMRLSILLLMLVSFLPFPAKLVAEAIDMTTAERAAFGYLLIAVVGVFRQRGDRTLHERFGSDPWAG